MAQAQKRKDIIKQILMKHITVTVNTTKFGEDGDIIHDACQDGVDDLPVDKLGLDQALVGFSLVLAGVS